MILDLAYIKLSKYWVIDVPALNVNMHVLLGCAVQVFQMQPAPHFLAQEPS